MYANSLQAGQLPEECQLAWALYLDLSSPTVQKFGLIDSVLECYGLELTIREFTVLIDQLDSIESGIQEWYEENQPKK